ncbi:hypothetical protein ACR3H8_33455 [Pseudomonas aeruginosa]|uniref:hypothetical protein n=1 Tax=Pseudomonas aeruginosa group TaxID=136841 RepID=UPI0003BAEB1D|nr:hypothetical protein [Pseudomonas aeruginosa]EIU2716244.1 hypothetical protein [Pseudomonas aeruginosa]EIU2863063.1 hypothetical protein [Pseudomonas aeruginosa]ELD5772967.1 hypothetical protein [Pseudomonas aeruginosa]ERW60455.1 hypothetical protein Q024_06575 [Pseudomonas aeruginosa BWHPSA011]ETV28685.1 hypothetical protein Q046_05602 [Pseudomonas aeruginosa BWHPSA041]
MQIELSTLQIAAGLILLQFVATLLSYQFRRFELCIAASAVLVAFVTGSFLAPALTPMASRAEMLQTSFFIGVVMGSAWFAIAHHSWKCVSKHRD